MFRNMRYIIFNFYFNYPYATFRTIPEEYKIDKCDMDIKLFSKIQNFLILFICDTSLLDPPGILHHESVKTHLEIFIVFHWLIFISNAGCMS